MDKLDSWLFPDSMDEAKAVQKTLAEKVHLEDCFSSLQWIGGMDVSHKLYDPSKIIHASTVVLGADDLKIKEHAFVSEKQTFPYIPGFLGFREAPSLVHAYQKLTLKPDLILVDGHGISHPRRLGIASHLGVLLDVPTIGVAKSILVGKPAETLSEEPGSQIPLIWQDQVIGMLLRTKKRSNPLIISAGHRITLDTAVSLVKQFLRGYKLPEPTRQAHLTANACRRQC